MRLKAVPVTLPFVILPRKLWQDSGAVLRYNKATMERIINIWSDVV